jgi:predicted nuclease of predicted toxin-antitoxin system
MKLLLDENLPKRLKSDFPNHQIFTVRDMGWNGKKNGELMKLLIENNFDALITFDKNLLNNDKVNYILFNIFVNFKLLRGINNLRILDKV